MNEKEVVVIHRLAPYRYVAGKPSLVRAYVSYKLELRAGAPSMSYELRQAAPGRPISNPELRLENFTNAHAATSYEFPFTKNS